MQIPLQYLIGRSANRIATWVPSTGTTVNTNGMPRPAVGTVSTPTLATTNLSTLMRRWRVTSAATADAAAEERSAGWVCWRGNADGLDGFTYVKRCAPEQVSLHGHQVEATQVAARVSPPAAGSGRGRIPAGLDRAASEQIPEWQGQSPMNTVLEPVSAEPPQEIASPTRPAGLPLMNTDPEPPDKLRG